eukprot:COSAG02_NODE_1048_length_14977_cov_26.690953_2_plen_212_part_00
MICSASRRTSPQPLRRALSPSPSTSGDDTAAEERPLRTPAAETTVRGMGQNSDAQKADDETSSIGQQDLVAPSQQQPATRGRKNVLLFPTKSAGGTVRKKFPVVVAFPPAANRANVVVTGHGVARESWVIGGCPDQSGRTFARLGFSAYRRCRGRAETRVLTTRLLNGFGVGGHIRASLCDERKRWHGCTCVDENNHIQTHLRRLYLGKAQ